MKYSFLTYLFCRYPLEYSFKMASAYGFDGIEIWGARPQAYAYDLDSREIAAINSMKRRYNVEISMYTPEILAYPYNLASTLSKEREETKAYLRRALEVTAELDAGRMLVTIPHSGFTTPLATSWKWAAEGLRSLCDFAERLHVKIVLESLSPSESNLITTADSVREMIRCVGSPALSTMMDIVPPTIANEPLALYLEPDDMGLDYIHITNTDAKTEVHAAFDEGVLPMKAVFSVLNRVGFDGWCSLELLNPYFKDPELYLADSIMKIREYTGECRR